MKPVRTLVMTSILAALLAGCASSHARKDTSVSSSLVSYLYGGKQPPEASAAPGYAYKLPARVALAFVPGSAGGETLSETLKAELLERVRHSFLGKPFIADIVIVPENYLRTGDGGFQTIDQLSRMYAFDVIALVSYDQVSLSSQNTSSMLYWTVVGSYLIKGERDDLSTFIDTAVFDVGTRKLMLRAPGTHRGHVSSRPHQNDRVVAGAREEGFTTATTDMIQNLDAALAKFHDSRERQRANKGS